MRRSKWQDGCLELRGKRRKVWFARYRISVMKPDGTITRVQVGRVIGTLVELPTKRAANDRLREIIGEANGAAPVVTSSFGTFINRWEQELLPLFKTSTQQGYRGLLRLYIRPRFGSMPLADISTVDVQSMVSAVAANHSPETTKRVWDLMSGLFRTAIEWKWAKENPCKGVKLPRRFRKPQPIVPPETAVQLFAVLGEPYATLLILFAITGFRRSEAFALRWNCIDWDLGLIGSSEAIVNGKWGTPKGQRETRYFPVPQWVLDRLRKLWQSSGCPGPEQPVFSSRGGIPINPSNVLNRHLWPACDQLGIERVSFHAFRRGVATDQVLSGIDPRTMQTWLGHKDVNTTLSYYAMADYGRLRSAVEAYGEKLRTTCVPIGAKITGPRGRLGTSTIKPTTSKHAPVAQKDRAAVS